MMVSRRKYASIDGTAQKVAPTLTATETKFLARLNTKYGSYAVHAAVDNIGRAAPRGRPSKGLRPYYEGIHLANWFEEAVEEHRANGSRTPIRDAENELYELMNGDRKAGDNAIFEAWRRNIKNKRLKARRDLADLRKAMGQK